MPAVTCTAPPGHLCRPKKPRGHRHEVLRRPRDAWHVYESAWRLREKCVKNTYFSPVFHAVFTPGRRRHRRGGAVGDVVVGPGTSASSPSRTLGPHGPNQTKKTCQKCFFRQKLTLGPGGREARDGLGGLRGGGGPRPPARPSPPVRSPEAPPPGGPAAPRGRPRVEPPGGPDEAERRPHRLPGRAVDRRRHRAGAPLPDDTPLHQAVPVHAAFLEEPPPSFVGAGPALGPEGDG